MLVIAILVQWIRFPGHFTQANMDRLRTAGYPGQMTPLEDGIGDYVGSYLNTSDPYR